MAVLPPHTPHPPRRQRQFEAELARVEAEASNLEEQRQELLRAVGEAPPNTDPQVPPGGAHPSDLASLPPSSTLLNPPEPRSEGPRRATAPDHPPADSTFPAPSYPSTPGALTQGEVAVRAHRYVPHNPPSDDEGYSEHFPTSQHYPDARDLGPDVTRVGSNQPSSPPDAQPRHPDQEDGWRGMGLGAEESDTISISVEGGLGVRQTLDVEPRLGKLAMKPVRGRDIPPGGPRGQLPSMSPAIAASDTAPTSPLLRLRSGTFGRPRVPFGESRYQDLVPELKTPPSRERFESPHTRYSAWTQGGEGSGLGDQPAQPQTGHSRDAGVPPSPPQSPPG